MFLWRSPFTPRSAFTTPPPPLFQSAQHYHPQHCGRLRLKYQLLSQSTEPVLAGSRKCKQSWSALVGYHISSWNQSSSNTVDALLVSLAWLLLQRIVVKTVQVWWGEFQCGVGSSASKTIVLSTRSMVLWDIDDNAIFDGTNSCQVILCTNQWW